MSGTTWTKFFWSDWDTDPALRLCSFAAQGLWMRMLCVAAAHDPIGYVAVAGRGLDETSIARMTGGLESEVRDLLGELDRNGVFSRDRHGRIYSRRMVNDAKRAAIARKNGKNGGNPSLSKDSGNRPPDNPPDKGGLKTQEPRASIQKREPIGSAGSADPPTISTTALAERVWAATPRPGRERSGRRDLERALTAARRRGGDPDAIVAGVMAYYASDDATKDSGQFAKGVHRIIENDRWAEFAAPQDDEPDWSALVALWAKSGRWSPALGPPPDAPGTRVPSSLRPDLRAIA